MCSVDWAAWSSGGLSLNMNVNNPSQTSAMAKLGLLGIPASKVN